MNTVLEATRQMVLMEHGEEANDLYLHTLKTAQIHEEEYFGHLVADDLSSILLPFPDRRILFLKNPAFVPQLTSQNPPVLLPRKSVCRHTLPHC